MPLLRAIVRLSALFGQNALDGWVSSALGALILLGTGAAVYTHPEILHSDEGPALIGTAVLTGFTMIGAMGRKKGGE